MWDSMPWGIAGECCFASTAGEWWSRRLCELSQGRAFFFSDVQEMHPKAGEGAAAPRGRRHGSRTRKPDAEQQGAHSTRFPAWVYPLAILIGAFTPPPAAPQAGEGGGAVPRGRRKARGCRTRKPDAEQQGGGAHSTRFPAWVEGAVPRAAAAEVVRGSPTQSSRGRFRPTSRYVYNPRRH